MYFVNESEDVFIFGVKAEGGGSEEDISDICSSLTGVGIERKDCVEFSDVFCTEDRIL